MAFQQTLAVSGCGGAARGAMRDLGQHLSVQECQARCAAAGPAVCNDLEYGRSNINYNCRAWTGTCAPYQVGRFNSSIFVKSAHYGSTYIKNAQL